MLINLVLVNLLILPAYTLKFILKFTFNFVLNFLFPLGINFNVISKARPIWLWIKIIFLGHTALSSADWVHHVLVYLSINLVNFFVVFLNQFGNVDGPFDNFWQWSLVCFSNLIYLFFVHIPCWLWFLIATHSRISLFIVGFSLGNGHGVPGDVVGWSFVNRFVSIIILLVLYLEKFKLQISMGPRVIRTIHWWYWRGRLGLGYLVFEVGFDNYRLFGWEELVIEFFLPCVQTRFWNSAYPWGQSITEHSWSLPCKIGWTNWTTYSKSHSCKADHSYNVIIDVFLEHYVQSFLLRRNLLLRDIIFIFLILNLFVYLRSKPLHFEALSFNYCWRF